MHMCKIFSLILQTHVNKADVVRYALARHREEDAWGLLSSWITLNGCAPSSLRDPASKNKVEREQSGWLGG